jgi:UDP-N-acetylglucosamine 2-epimerase (non-hydrolysing)
MARKISNAGQHSIVSFAGTRPEAIKLAPVAIAALETRGIRHRLIATGQQDRLFDQAAKEVGADVDRRLGHFPGGGDMAQQMTAIRQAVTASLVEEPPDLVLVQGDTNSALAAAQAAHGLGILVGHVEAGLRSHNLRRPWPEEPNRIAIGGIASLHFAPSLGAVLNLEREGVAGSIVLTGNPGIDALLSIKPVPFSFARPTILVTCHRRENFGAPLRRIAHALATIAITGEADIVLPLHPNGEVREVFSKLLGQVPGVRLIEPLGYRAMLGVVRAARFVLSDSGGLQEECAALGVPLLLMRLETERPEVIESGNCRLVGDDADIIIRESLRLIRESAHHKAMSRPAWPYGRGTAARRIIAAISLHFSRNCTMGPHHDTEMDPRQLAGPQRSPDAQLPGRTSA